MRKWVTYEGRDTRHECRCWETTGRSCVRAGHQRRSGWPDLYPPVGRDNVAHQIAGRVWAASSCPVAARWHLLQDVPAATVLALAPLRAFRPAPTTRAPDCGFRGCAVWLVSA